MGADRDRTDPGWPRTPAVGRCMRPLAAVPAGPEYDQSKMNDPLESDPDDTGVRAALTAAAVSDELQHIIWRSVAAVLKMLSVEFDEAGDGSTVRDQAAADEVANMLKLPDTFGLC